MFEAIDRPPARYAPFEIGRYEIKPGLNKFGRPSGNGAIDEHVFQIDRTFPAYRAEKLAARRERLDRYYKVTGLPDALVGDACRFIVGRLAAENSEAFSFHHRDGTTQLQCGLTGETLRFDDAWRLIGADSAARPSYVDAFDALACQVQEDLCLTRRTDDAGGAGWLCAAHVCMPSFWSVEEKVGRSFQEVHKPVAGIEPINRLADAMIGLMHGSQEGLTRFAWGVTFDASLNRHPTRAAMLAQFDPQQPVAFVRVERQTMWGLAGEQGAIFTIRPYLYDIAPMRRTPAAEALAAAIRSMTPASLHYKGLAGCRDALLAWICG